MTVMPILHRMLYALRYHKGYIFIDKAGQILNDLLYSNEEWLIKFRSMDRFEVRRDSTNTVFGYGTEQIDLEETRTDQVVQLRSIDDFASEAQTLSRRVITCLSLSSFTRIGFRTWFLFGVTDADEGLSQILQNKLYRISETASKLGDTEDTSFSIVLNRKIHKVRIALAVAEQEVKIAPELYDIAMKVPHEQRSQQRKALLEKIRAKKKIDTFPPHAVLVDMDFYMEDPPCPDKLKIVDFIGECGKETEDLLKSIF